LPEAPVSSLVLRNVKIAAQHGLTIRYARVSGKDLVVEASDGQPITKLAGAKVSLR
jgi:hypothetical protein